jgi:mannose-6-phosphate isomerase-like protein (cupin superfamily)
MESSAASINLQSKLEKFSEQWSPKIVATFNGHDVMVVKVKGEFIWHSHPETDDFFHVLKGTLRIELRDAAGNLSHVNLNPGELYVVPRGVEHRPVAIDEVHLLLIEPTGTPNTGDPATAARKDSI